MKSARNIFLLQTKPTYIFKKSSVWLGPLSSGAIAQNSMHFFAKAGVLR